MYSVDICTDEIEDTCIDTDRSISRLVEGKYHKHRRFEVNLSIRT